MNLEEYIADRKQMLDELVTQYPKQIPAPKVAEILGMDVENLRTSIDRNQSLGLSWLKAGKCNKGYAIPTMKFVCFYLHLNILS